MANRMIKKVSTDETKPKAGIGKGLSALISGRFLTRQYVQENLLFIVFLVAVMVAYIGYGYFAEQNSKMLVAAESALAEEKATNLSLVARLDQLKKQSHVAQSFQHIGLVESLRPPYIIRVEEGDLDPKKERK